MFGIGIVEILVILGVALIIIGPKNLPDLAKSLGKAYMEFMSAFHEMQRSIQDDVSDIQKTVDEATNVIDHNDTDVRKEEPKQEKKNLNHSRREGEPR